MGVKPNDQQRSIRDPVGPNPHLHDARSHDRPR